MEINFLFLFMISVILGYHLSAGVDEDYSRFHLPGDINPLRYELTINTDPDDFVNSHTGDVRIKIQCTEETKHIFLNCASLEINESNVKVNELINEKDEGKDLEIVPGPNYDWETERYIIELKENLVEGKNYVVNVPFSKKMDHNLPHLPAHGYMKRPYRSKVLPHHLKPLVYTKMGRITARTIFPNLDQIDIKTPIQIKLGHPKSVMALSNANKDFEASVPGKPDWILDVFKDTAPMTTYSVTMALLNFDSKKTIEPSSNVEIRVWSDEAEKELIDYVFPIAFHSLKFYFNFFQVPFGFQKLDVVILEDELIEAWKSYGLILLSEEYVKNTLEKSKTEFELVSDLSKVISQQWIDYRVTMIWWDQNWFHRGINCFLNTMCIKQILPEWELSNSAWDIIDSFILVQKNESMGMYNPILTLDEFPDNSVEVENAETEKKICQLIRMTNFFLGSQLFRERLRTYVDTFGFTHSSLPQVWQAFGTALVIKKENDDSESFSVQEVLETWLIQRGIPLINVKLDYEAKQITVTQEPFISLQLSEEIKEEGKKQNRIIPLTYTTESELKFENVEIRGWLTPKQPLVLPVDHIKRDQWIILNLQFNVLGHVNYDPDNWNAIQRSLLHPQKYWNFDVLTRSRLVHDIFALAEAGKLSYTYLFKTMKFLRQEQHDLPWRTALAEFDILYSRVFRSERMRGLIKTYVSNLLYDIYVRRFNSLDLVTFEEADYVDYRRKIRIVGASCKYGVYRCHESTRSLRIEWSTEKLINKPRELRKIILCEAIKYDSRFVPDTLRLTYRRHTKKPSDWTEDLIEALSCSPNEKILQSLLKDSLKDEDWHQDDRFRFFKSLSTNPASYKLMKTFFKENYENIRGLHLHDNSVTTLSYLQLLIGMSRTSTEIHELTDFATSVQLNWNTLEIHQKIVDTKKSILWLTSFRKYTQEHPEELRRYN